MSGVWRFAAALTGTRYRIRHVADDEPENPTPYWHVQSLIVSELAFNVAYGIRPDFGIEAMIPLRSVKDEVHYLDLAGEPYTPPNPGLHHRDETLTRLADPQLTFQFGHAFKPVNVSGRVGLSVPLGKTEPNPFELGRQGLWHQHIQFGSGTWDPILGIALSRKFGELDTQFCGYARLTFAENSHGYKAGNRYSGLFDVSHKIGSAWSMSGGLVLNNESAERWSGIIETEGNLGRTDLLVAIGAGRTFKTAGVMSINVQVPIASHSTGEQVKIPWVLSIGWER